MIEYTHYHAVRYEEESSGWVIYAPCGVILSNYLKPIRDYVLVSNFENITCPNCQQIYSLEILGTLP